MPRLLIDGTAIQPNPKGVGRYAYHVCLRLGDILPSDWMIDVLLDLPGMASFPKTARLNLVAVRKRSEIHKALFLLPKQARRLGSQLLLKADESAGRLRGLPTVAVCHDIDELIWAAQKEEPSALRRVLDGYKLWLRKRMLRGCTYVLCNSEFIRNSVHREYGVPAERLRVAYCAVDEKFYALSRLTDTVAVRHKYGVPRFVLAFATGDTRENFNAFPGVAAHLAGLGIDTCLLVAGLHRDAPYRTRLMEEFIRHGLVEGRHFIFEEFLGTQRFTDLVDLYTAADFYLELSLHEGFGMQLLEAMACGTTCVSSPRGALREIGDQFALFVDPTDAGAVARRIKQAYEEGQDGRDNGDQIRYTRKFDWGETAKVIAEALLQAASH